VAHTTTSTGAASTPRNAGSADASGDGCTAAAVEDRPGLLAGITQPAELRRLDRRQLAALADEIR
jgi:hypothetical protein